MSSGKQTTPHPVISRHWKGQTNFKRQTDTENLIHLDSPYRWHERLMGTILRTICGFK